MRCNIMIYLYKCVNPYCSCFDKICYGTNPALYKVPLCHCGDNYHFVHTNSIIVNLYDELMRRRKLLYSTKTKLEKILEKEENKEYKVTCINSNCNEYGKLEFDTIPVQRYFPCLKCGCNYAIISDNLNVNILYSKLTSLRSDHDSTARKLLEFFKIEEDKLNGN